MVIKYTPPCCKSSYVCCVKTFQLHQCADVVREHYWFKTQATNTPTTTNYANVIYDSLTYNMTSATLTIQSNRKWCHYRFIYPVDTCSYDWKSRMNIYRIPTATQRQDATGPQPLFHPLPPNSTTLCQTADDKSR